MHMFLVEMCRSCLKQDVPLFEAMEDKASNKKVKISTIIQDLFRKDIIEEYNWKLCEDCTMLLKRAVVLENCLLSSKSIYNNYLRMFDGNNRKSSNILSKLSVQMQDMKVTTEKTDLVNARNATVEESTAYKTDGCPKTEFLSDVESLDGDLKDTKMKIEIDETNHLDMLYDFQCAKETAVNIKTETYNENLIDSTVENMAVEQHSNAALSETSSKHLQLNVRTTMNADEDFSNDKETREVNLNSEKDLAVHLPAHRDVKSYECDLCTKVFSLKSTHIRHRRIHTGEKPYKCDLCTKSFAARSNYKEHRRIHTGEKPYKCDLCTKAFSNISQYDEHKRFHTGEYR